MNTSFFSRVGALLRYDFRVFGSKVLLLYLAFLLLAAIVEPVVGYRFALGIGQIIYQLVMPVVFMGVVVEVICRKFVKADTATSYVMLPATVFEKWSVAAFEVLLCVWGASFVICNVALWIIQFMVTLSSGTPLSTMQFEFYDTLFLPSAFVWLKNNLMLLFFLIFVAFAFKCRLRYGMVATTAIFVGELAVVAVVYGVLLSFIDMCEPMQVFRTVASVVVPVVNAALLYYSYRLVRTNNIC